MLDAAFREEDHPRDPAGKFGSGGGGGGGGEGESGKGSAEFKSEAGQTKETWHGTSSAYIAAITKEGLRIDPGHRSGPEHFYKGVKGESVYVAPNVDDAIYFAKLATEKSGKGHEPVMLKVTIPPDVAKGLKNDQDLPGALRYEGNIPPEWITVVPMPAQKNPRSWMSKDSADAGKAMYLVVTMPEDEEKAVDSIATLDQGGPFLAGVRTFLRGLMQWVAEEENEGEHGNDADEFKETDHPRGPGGMFGNAGKAAAKHGFTYKGEEVTNEPGRAEKRTHHWEHPSGATMRLSKGGVGRESGSHVATIKSGPNTEHTGSHGVWPENAVNQAAKKWQAHRAARGDKADAALPEKPDAPGGANDGAMAFDRSLRSKDADGRLHVETSNISKATVNPYPGNEIPDHEALGLDPSRIYMLLRHPDELSKPETIKSFNNLQILSKHVPVSTDSADSHRAELTIGSLGTDAEWAPPYLKNSLVFWAKPAIEAIENDEMKELSCAYRYTADMTPGTYEGQRYDGIMRDLVGNHLALVKKGRAGPDVVVGDSAEGLQGRVGGETKEDAMPKFTPAMLAGGFKKALSGVKLKSGKLAQDANIDEILPLIETIIGSADDPIVDNGGGMMTDPNGGMPAGATMDETDEEKEARIRADCRAGDAARRLGRDETDEERKKREDDDAAADSAAKAAKDAAKTAKDAKAAKDKAKDGEAEKEDKEEASDSNGFRAVTGDKGISKAAMDQALATQRDAILAQVARTQREIREAERAVRPYVGDLAMDHDSPEGVFRTALTARGVDVAKVHPSAFPALLAMLPKAGAQPQQERTVAMDAAAASSFAERFPGSDKITVL